MYTWVFSEYHSKNNSYYTSLSFIQWFDLLWITPYLLARTKLKVANTYWHTYFHSKHIHTCTLIHTQIHTHTYTKPIHRDTHTQRHININTHTDITHTNTHKDTHIQTHTHLIFLKIKQVCQRTRNVQKVFCIFCKITYDLGELTSLFSSLD